MRLELVVDEVAYEVAYDPAAATVRIGKATYPVRVLEAEGIRIELEIAGEKAVVEGWPAPTERPTGRLSVNGEVVVLGPIVRSTATAPGPAGGPADRPAPPAGPSGAVAPSGPEAPAGAPAAGPGRPVHPPMPGKILEIRVRDGERVTAGQVLLVLEAMKMRNEVASPVDGVVAGLSASVGGSVRARDILLRIVPD